MYQHSPPYSSWSYRFNGLEAYSEKDDLAHWGRSEQNIMFSLAWVVMILMILESL